MKRRHVLQALVAAPALSAQDLAVVTPDSVAKPRLHFFTEKEIENLRQLADQIIPSLGGKPGAKEANAAEFLDFYISRCSKEDQQLYRQGLASVSSLELLDKPWTYQEPTDIPSRFVRRLKEDVLRATFNSQQWIASSGRRGGGTNYYWNPVD